MIRHFRFETSLPIRLTFVDTISVGDRRVLGCELRAPAIAGGATSARSAGSNRRKRPERDAVAAIIWSRRREE